MDLTILAAPTPEHMRDIPVPPIVVGIVFFVGLMIMMGILLMFGKGRPHT
ncbi:MAG: hypothetical protein ACRDP4_04400 [Nocardioidaceae bacterium]